MRKLLGSIGWVLLLNLLVKPAWLITENKVQDLVGHEVFGLYAAVLGASQLLLILADPGLNLYYTRLLAKNPEAYEQWMARLFSLKVLLSVAFLLVMAAVAWVMGYWRESPFTVGAVMLYQFGITLLMLSRANLQGAGLYRLDGSLSVLERSLLLAGLGVLAFWGWTMAGFLSLLAGAGLTVGVAALVLVRVRLGPWRWTGLDRRSLNLLRLSLPFALTVVLHTSLDRLNLVLLEVLGGPLEAGLYSGAFRWFSAACMYLWTILPIFFAQYARQSDNDRVSVLLRNSQGLVALPLLLLAGAWLVFPETVIQLFSNNTPQEDARMHLHLQLLSATLALGALMHPFSTVLTARGFERSVNLAWVGALLLALGVEVLGYPIWGPLGASLGLLLAYAWLLVSLVALYRRLVHRAIPWRNLLGWSLWFVLYALGLLFLGPVLSSAWLTIGLMAVLGVLLALAARLIPLRAWLNRDWEAD